MFPRSLRLSRTGFGKSRGLSRATSPHFSISYGSLSTTAGVGVIVPKKAVKSAVGRHLLKRRVREIVRGSIRSGQTALTIIISARSGASALSFDELRDELSVAFKAILPENV